MNKFFLNAVLLAAAAGLFCAPAEGALYDPGRPLRVTAVSLSDGRPKGFGRFEPRQNNEYKRGDDAVYIYIEVENCKPNKKGMYYVKAFSMDVDIYYEDGACIYSEEDANVFEDETKDVSAAGYLWTMIDASALREGEYKVEMTIKDENTGKEAFALVKFKKVK